MESKFSSLEKFLDYALTFGRCAANTIEFGSLTP